MENPQLKSLLETLIFVAEKPLKVSEMLDAWELYQKSLVEAPAEAEALETEAEAGEGEALEAAPEGSEAAELPSDEEFDIDVNPERAFIPGEEDAAAQLQAKVLEESEKLSRSDIASALQEMEQEYLSNPQRGIILAEVGGGWQFRTRPENAAIIRGFYQPKPTKLSKPSLETMAIVAYRQPITRVEIDLIRGVDSGGVLKTLLEKNLVRIVGKKEEPGKPMLYGTTQEFLELFQLSSLKDLPTLKEFRELEEEFQRKSGAEGTVVENTMEGDEPVDPKDFTLNAAPVREMLSDLEDEEEEEVLELEESLKNLRKLEKDIFKEEKSEEAAPAEPVEDVPSAGAEGV